MAELPIRSQAGASSASGSSGDISHIGPGGQAEPALQGVAEGGRFVGVPSAPKSTSNGGSGYAEGYDGAPGNPPLPSPGS